MKVHTRAYTMQLIQKMTERFLDGKILRNKLKKLPNRLTGGFKIKMRKRATGFFKNKKIDGPLIHLEPQGTRRNFVVVDLI